jgi:internalin A
VKSFFGIRQAWLLCGSLLALSSSGCGVTVQEGELASNSSAALCAATARFQDYCEVASSLPASTKSTVDALLKIAQTQDCATAQTTLDALTSLEIFEPPAAGISRDLAPIATLTRLTSLALYMQRVEDLRPLTRLTSLVQLAIRMNDVVRAPGAAPWLYECPITDPENFSFGPLGALDLHPLEQLTKLTSLELRGVIADDTRPLGRLNELTSLGLDCARFDGNLAPFAALPNLTSIDVANGVVRDLSPLASFPKIGQGFILVADGSPIESLRPIALMTDLAYLQLDPSSRFPALPRDEAHCPTRLDGMREDVRTICLERNVSSPAEAAEWLSRLRGAPVTEDDARAMTSLDLSGLTLDPADVLFVQGFPALQSLDLSRGQNSAFAIAYLRALASEERPFPKARELVFRGINLNMSLFPSAPLPFVERVDLRDNGIRRIGVLVSAFPNLQSIALEGNPIGKTASACPADTGIEPIDAFCALYVGQH